MMRNLDYTSMVAIPSSASDPLPRICLMVAMIQSRNCCIVVSSSGYFCIFYRYVETAFAQRVGDLPTRYLPPGSLKMLYHEFALRYPTVSYLEQAYNWYGSDSWLTFLACLFLSNLSQTQEWHILASVRECVEEHASLQPSFGSLNL